MLNIVSKKRQYACYLKNLHDTSNIFIYIGFFKSSLHTIDNDFPSA